jgi:hypothetical protein
LEESWVPFRSKYRSEFDQMKRAATTSRVPEALAAPPVKATREFASRVRPPVATVAAVVTYTRLWEALVPDPYASAVLVPVITFDL